MFSQIMELAADIDAVQALACCAYEYHLTRPTLVNDPVLDIVDGYARFDCSD